jgi:acyl dehydratase
MSNHCTFHTIEELRQAVGQEAFVTDWVLIDQKRIDLFAQATDDPQWIHVDPVRAAKESPFGCTIAHGFLTLSLLGRFYDQHMALPFCKMGINYPVKVDRSVRGRFVLAKLEDIAGGVQMTFSVTIEIQGEERPACVAESVVRQYFEAAV